MNLTKKLRQLQTAPVDYELLDGLNRQNWKTSFVQVHEIQVVPIEA